jgi:hypothetical protein
MQYMAGKMKICEYNVNKLYGCSGVLNALEDDCGCRKSSHFNWYIKTGQDKSSRLPCYDSRTVFNTFKESFRVGRRCRER